MKKPLILFLALALGISIVSIKMRPPKYYLSAVAIFRNEGRILKEWIEYNRMMGVEHFYLFNHMSDDGYMEVLKPYVEEGVVELWQWPYGVSNQKEWNKVQCKAYEKVVRERGRETRWLAIVDVDEFVLPMEGDIAEFLKDYEAYAGVAINWQLYGTGGVERVEGTYIGSLTKKAPQEYERNRYVKSIVQPQRVKKIHQPHYCKYKKGYFHVDENGVRFPSRSLTDGVSVEKIRINHYTNQDGDFFYNEKRRRLKEWFPGAECREDAILNAVEDDVMRQYVGRLEERL